MSKRRGSFFETNLQPHRRTLKDALFKEFQEIPIIKATSTHMFNALVRIIRSGNPDSSDAQSVVDKFTSEDKPEIKAILDSFSQRFHALDPRMESANVPSIPHNAAYNAGLRQGLNRYTKRVRSLNHGQEHFRPFRYRSSETKKPKLEFLGTKRLSQIERWELAKAHLEYADKVGKFPEVNERQHKHLHKYNTTRKSSNKPRPTIKISSS
jgi:hypothetical protein